MIYTFGQYKLDIDQRELHHTGKPVELGDKAFCVLAYLICHRGRVVSKDELFNAVWQEESVTEGVVFRSISDARKAIGDGDKQLIRTQYGRGYRFMGKVEEHPQATLDNAALTIPPTPRDAATHTAENAVAASYPGPPIQPHSGMPLDGERRQVTVLHCNLTNAIVLAEQHETDITRILHDVFALGVRTIRQYEGTVNPFVSDGFTALFGASRAYEDHARRALLAAAELQKCLREHWTSFNFPAAVGPALGTGLHTGFIMAQRSDGERRLTYLSVGDTFDLAALLARHAESDTILISTDTAKLIRGVGRLKVLAPLQLSGRTSPTPVLAVRRVRSQHARLGRRRPHRFVGRKQELALLQERLERVISGQGQVVSIIGEAGIGKSRLLYEFRRRLRGASVTYLEGRCLSHGHAIPYFPVGDLLRTVCSITQSDSSKAIGIKVRQFLAEWNLVPDESAPYLLQLLGKHPETQQLAGRHPETIRTRTFAILRQLLFNACQRQPLILVIEDVQWLDPTSEALCAALVDLLPSVPLLLLVTYRTDYQPPWPVKSYATSIALQPLTPRESLRMVQTRQQARTLSETVIQEILTRAEGNPFFLEELIHAIAEEADPQAPLMVPDTIQNVLMTRISRLPEAPRRLLQMASVFGREWSLPLLHTIWTEPEALAPLLLTLQQHELLYEQTVAVEATYYFHHALTQEAIYESLSTTHRQALHMAIGQAIERHYADRLEEMYDHLAYHYARTDEHAKAVEYLTRFAEQATQKYAHREAAMALQEALKHVQALSSAAHVPAVERHRRSLDVVLRLAQSLSFLGRFAQSLDLLLEHREHLEQLQEPMLAGRYYFRLGRTYSLLGDQEQAVVYTRRARDEASRGGDMTTTGLAYYELARELFVSGLPRQGLEHGQQAVALLERTQEQWWLGMTLWIVAVSHAVLGEFALALAATARAQAMGAAIDDLHVQSYAAFATGWIEATRGAWDTAISACKQSLEWARDPVNKANATWTLGYAYLEQGNAEQAVALLEQAVQQWQHFNVQPMQGWIMAYLAEAYLAAQQLAQAHDAAHRALNMTTTAKFRFAMGCAQRVLGRVVQTTGDLTAAATHLTAALETFTAVEARFELGRTHLTLAVLAHNRRQGRATRTHLTEAYMLFQALQVSAYQARTRQLAHDFAVSLPATTRHHRR